MPTGTSGASAIQILVALSPVYTLYIYIHIYMYMYMYIYICINSHCCFCVLPYLLLVHTIQFMLDVRYYVIRVTWHVGAISWDTLYIEVPVLQTVC